MKDPPVAWAAVESDDDETCAQVDSIARNVLASLKTDPPFRASDALIPLATHGPCEVLGKLPADMAVTKWKPSIDPYMCAFSVADDTSEDVSVQVALQVVYNDDVQPDETVIDMGGVTMVKEGGITDLKGARLSIGNAVDIDVNADAARAAGAGNNRAFPVVHIYADTWAVVDELAQIAVVGFGR